MFEQSILLPNPETKRWTFAASILVEVTAVSVLLLIPLVYTEQLGGGWIQSSVLRMPGTPPPPTPQPPLLRTTTTSVSHRTFNPLEAPRTIPRTIAMNVIDDQPPPPPCPNCVAGSIPTRVPYAIGTDGPATVLPPPPLKPKPAEAKKAAEPPPAPVNVSKGTQEAKIIRRVIPTYPALAKQARVQGLVKLLGVISIDGRIERLQVISGHPLLVPAAVDAVKQWTYRPTLLNGVPVEVMAPIDVNFILSN